tara:strand:+ start:310 stop:1143 length:834 start_codon:yes stop_codon:yes gene_type:complete
MEMAARSVKYAIPKDDSYEFQETLPDDALELYGKKVFKHIKDVDHIKNFFKDSLIDVDFIILPDAIFQNLFLTGGFLFADSKGLMPLYKLKALLKGRYNKLTYVLDNIEPDVYTIISQKSDTKDLGFFVYDLPWLAHDVFGHALTFPEVKSFMDKIKYALTAVGGTANIIPQSISGHSTLGTIDLDPMHSDSTTSRMMEEEDFSTDLIKFFKRERFTGKVNKHDLPASVIGYYIVKGVFPDPIYKYFYHDHLQRYEAAIVKSLEVFKGKIGIMEFEG